MDLIGRMDLYIYYKVDPRNAANLQQKIMALQAELSSDGQVQAQLKQRTNDSLSADTLQTWMEVYTCVPQGFLMVLQSACDASNVHALITGERHHEFFMDIAACA